MDAPATDLDAGTDLEEFESDLAEGGRSQIGVAQDPQPAGQDLSPHYREHEMGEGAQ